MTLTDLTIVRPVVGNLVVIPENGSVHKQGLMSEDYLDVYFTTDQIEDFGIGDYVVWNTQHYHINQLPTVRKVAGNLFAYNIKFEAYFYDMAKYLFLTIDGQETDFELTGDASVFMELLIENMNRIGPDVYTLGTPPVTRFITISFSGVNCLEALRDICNQFGLEYSFYDFQINLTEYAPPTTSEEFSYNPTWMDTAPTGNGGIREITRDVLSYENMATRLYGFGGTKNLPANYGQARLRFQSGSVSKNDDVYGIFERAVIFEDIYPRLQAAVTTDPSGTYRTIHSTDVTFNINTYHLNGEPWSIKFQTGDLSGYEFPIDYSPATGYIIINGILEDGAVIPNATLHCHAGDEFVLLNIAMPSSYVTDAEAELLAASTAELEKYCYPKIKYSVLMDWQYFKTNEVGLVIGQTITITDTDLGLNDAIRIIGLERSLTNPYEYRVELSDFLQRNLIRDIVTDIRRLVTKKQEKRSLKSGVIPGENFWKRDALNGRIAPAVNEDWVKIGVAYGTDGVYDEDDIEYGYEPANATLDVEGSTATSTVVLTKADEDIDTFLYITNRYSTVHIDASGGNLKPLLPAPSSCKRRTYRLICDNIDNTIIISSVSGNVGSGATLAFGYVGQVFLLQSDSANWNLISSSHFQADWTELDSANPSFIIGKPDLTSIGRSHSNTETVSSGVQTITFTTAFTAGDEVVMPTWLNGVTAGPDPEMVWARPYDISITGFKINFNFGCTFSYTANKKQ